jgi:hypothetical protein
MSLGSGMSSSAPSGGDAPAGAGSATATAQAIQQTVRRLECDWGATH